MRDRPAHRDGDAHAPREMGRRRFIGYLLAAPTVAAAAQLGLSEAESPASAAVPEPADIYDLNDLLTEAALPTSGLITVQVHSDGTASFEMPRVESGQGVTTMAAMLIAEELDLPVEKVRVTLADARPELVFNQFTAGSNTAISIYTPIRVAAAVAKGRLLRAASAQLGDATGTLTSKLGVVTSVAGTQLPYGDLAEQAASNVIEPVEAVLKPESEFRIIGKPHNRIDALEAVTGRKKYSMDLDVGAAHARAPRTPSLSLHAQGIPTTGDMLAFLSSTH